ncbi:Cardiolipin synthase A [Streptomyces microflavus]
MVQTPSNPGGLPIEVFDGFRASLVANRAQFDIDVPSGPFYGFNRPGAEVSKGVVDNWWRQGMQGAANAHYECIKAFSETDFTEDLRAIDVPVLVAHGTDDQIVPYDDSAPLSVALLKNGRLKSYDGFPHGMLTTHPEVLNPDLLAFIQEWCGDARNENEWRDTHVQVRGPAVDGLAAAFAQNWAECQEELFDDRDRFVASDRHGDAVVQVVRGSSSFGWQDMQTLMRVVLESAEERIRLTTAYFAPDDYFTGLLCAAARRGVEVEILLPGPHTDKRVCQLAGQRHYEELTACGVKIYQYQPTMMHAKTLTIDRIASLIGSTNFNRRSLDHDEEVMLAVMDCDFTAALDGHFDEDREKSVLIERGRWKRRDVLQRVREAAVVPIRRYL